MPRQVVLFLLLPLLFVIAEERESRGAVPGLMPPLMEFQFASRMHGTRIFEIEDNIVRQGQASITTEEPIASGTAQGMLVTKVKEVGGGREKPEDGLEQVKFADWRIVGLEKKIAPIRTYIQRVTQAADEGEKFNAIQIEALNKWVKKFSEADEACKKEPSLANLEALSDVLLWEVSSVFESIDRPDVVLLEAILEAATSGRRLRNIRSHWFELFLALHKAKPQREDYSITSDGVTIYPPVILFSLKDRKPISGLRKTFGKTLGKILARLKKIEKTPDLFPQQGQVIRALIKELEANQTSLDDGSIQSFETTGNLLERVENLLFVADCLAPLALRRGVDAYSLGQLEFFEQLQEKVSADGDPKKAEFKFTLDRGEIKYLRKDDPEVTLEAKGIVAKQLDVLRSLAEQTLKQSRMAATEQKVLTDAIEAIKSSRAALGKPTLYRHWLTWTKAIHNVMVLF